MKHLFLVLCVAVCSGAANFLEDFPPVVNIPWRNSFLPCECSGSTLDCSERGKSSLSASDAVCKTSIRAVNLFDNALRDFPDGVESAEIVNASRNQLTEFPRPAQLNDHVILLDLSENNITKISSSIRNLAFLQTLKLRKNSLENLDYHPQPCSLVNLEVASNKISSLPGSLLQCIKLETLDVSDNNITTLYEEFLNFTRLTSLDLSWNPVAPLSRNIFASLSVLKELRLDGVGLSDIPEGLFDSLVSLEYLSLDGNGLTRVNGNSFSALNNLIYLSISRNTLRSFPAHSFQNFSSLEELHLAGNELTSLPPAPFVLFSRLKFVNIDSNKFSSLPEYVFSGVNNLDTVFMRDCVSARNLSSNLFSNLSSLQLISVSASNFLSEFLETISHVPYVQCSNCGLTSLSARAFQVLSRTRALSIEYNSILSISDSALEGLTYLAYLSLGGNNITTLPSAMFSPVRQITRLHLWDNKLATLPERIFSGLSNLSELTLNQNELTVLPESIFNETTSLERLDLSQNLLVSLPINLFRNLSLLWELNLANNHLVSFPFYDATCVSLRAVSLEQNDFRALPSDILNPWLFAGSSKRFVNVSHNSSKIDPQSVDWLFQNVEIAHSENRRDCGCTSVRSEKSLLRYCVNITCAVEF